MDDRAIETRIVGVNSGLTVGPWDMTRESREGEPGTVFRIDLATQGIDGVDDESCCGERSISKGKIRRHRLGGLTR